MNNALASYAATKHAIADDLGATQDVLHMHAGLLIFFFAALAFKRRLRSRVPIALVYLFAVANEVLDAFAPGTSTFRWEPAVDILNTVVWPTLIFLLARRGEHVDDVDRAARWM